MCSKTLQEYLQVLLKAPEVKLVHSECYNIDYWNSESLVLLRPLRRSAGNFETIWNLCGSSAGDLVPWSHSSSSGASAKNVSVRAEWLRQSGRAPSEPSETPRWRITPRPASIPRVALHIALRSQLRSFFSLCRSPILNKHSGIVGNCDHTSEWVHWVHPCIGIAMQWVTLRKSLLAFLLH